MAEKKNITKEASELRRFAEEKAVTSPDNLKAMSPEETRQALHELQVFQIELEMQNAELRTSQLDLETARESYFDLYNLAPVGYVTVSEKGLILEANLTVATLLGVTRGALTRQPFSKFILKEDQDIYYLYRRKLLGTDASDVCDLRMVKKEGKPFWANLKMAIAQHSDCDPEYLVVISDISERKRAEEVQSFLAQTSSGPKGEPFFNVLARYLAQSLQMDFVCIDRLDGDGLTAHTLSVWCDGHFEDNVSYALKDTPCGDVVGKTVCCFPASVCQFFPRDQVLRDLNAESYVGVTLWNLAGKPIGLIAVIGHKPLANRALAESTLKLVAGRAASELERIQSDEALLNSRTAAMNLMEDADEARRVAEETGMALREKQEVLNLFVRHAPAAVAMFDRDMGYLAYSSRWMADYGLGQQELIGRSHYEVFPEIDDRWRSVHKRCLQGNAEKNEEDYFVRRDGQKEWLKWEIHPWRTGTDEVGGIIIFSEIITERKQAQEERDITIEFLRLANECASIEELISMSNAFFQRYSGCEAVGIRLKSGEDYPYFETRGFPGEFVKIENSLCSKDCNGNVLRDSSGNPLIECMCGNVICGRFDPSKPFFTSKGSFWTNSTTELLASTTEADRQSQTRKRCNGEGYESVALVPLYVGKERLGLLQLNDRKKNVFMPRRISLWERIADLLAVSISKLLVEDELRQSEEKFRAIATSTPDHILVQDAGLRYVMVINPQMGLTEKDMIGRRDSDFLSNEDAAKITVIKTRILQTGIPEHLSIPMTDRDGNMHYFEGSYIPRRYSQGQVDGIIGYFRNVTARKQMEESLRLSQADLNRAQAVAHIGSWRMDVRKNELLWSEENHRIFGIPEGTAKTYETFLSTIHPNDVLLVDRKWQEALRGEPYDVEHRIIVGGKVKWVREKAELEFDGKGGLLGGFGTTQDVTERKTREEEIYRLNRTLKALIHSNQAIMRSKDEMEYMDEVCKIVVEDCGHKMVWIGFAENDKEKSVVPVAAAGFEEGYLDRKKITWSDTERGRGPTGMAIRTGKPSQCRNMLTDPAFLPWREEAVRRGYASSVVFPLMNEGRAYGAISIYSKEPDSFSDDEMSLLSELTGDLSYGIVTLRLRKLHADTEKALITSEKKYRTLFEGMTEGFALHEIICDHDGRPVDYRFLEINPAFERLTGLRRKDVLYRTHNEVLPGDDMKWVEMYGKVALSGEPVSFENYAPPLKKYFQVFAYCPAPRQFAVIFMDMSGRKEAEAELRRSEQRQLILSESSSVLLEAADPQKSINEICRKTMEFLDCQVFFNFLFVEERNKLRLNAYAGISDEEAERIGWLDFGVAVCGCVARDGERVITEDIFRTNDPRTDLIKSFGVHAYCCHPLKADEKIIGTISFGTTNRDSFTEDEISMMKATAEMVTVAMQRKEWERKLVESEERLRLAQLSANVGVWEWEPDTDKLFFTPELERLYGMELRSIRRYSDFRGKVHPDDFARIEKERSDAIDRHSSFDLEFRINYSDTEIRWLSTRGGAIYDEDGDVLRVFGVNSDITVRKLAEEILKRDKETLESIVKERSEKLVDIQLELERAKRLSDIGTLASTVAHELRNPLAAINMSAAIIRRKASERDPLVDKQLRSIEKMVTESDQIINNLLFYSRLRSPQYESVSIHGIIEECVGNLRMQIKKQMQFRSNFDSLKDIGMSADPLQMREVFNNLLHNAADAVPDIGGEVEIAGENYPELIRIRVQDNGHGIDAQHLAKIFDPFFTTKAKGTGLGLTVCNQIVNMHGGTIDIQSEIDKGTTVSIVLPKREKGKMEIKK